MVMKMDKELRNIEQADRECQVDITWLRKLLEVKDEEMKDRDIELLKEQMRPALAERDELKRETSPSLR